MASFGWGNDRDLAEESYQIFFKEFMEKTTNYVGATKDWLILGLAWDGSGEGFKRLAHDVSPSQQLAVGLSWLPDKLAFVPSFWAKANTASDIGSDALQDAMQIIVESYDKQGQDRPNIYLVGHSFGARLVASLAKTTLGKAQLENYSSETTFPYLDQIKGMVFIQAAMTQFDVPTWKIPEKRKRFTCPIFVTSSDHDHANSFLYPLANSIYNTYMSSGYELLDLSARSKALSAIKIPLSFLITQLYNIANYPWSQFQQVRHRGFHYVPDTLAQLPVLGVGIKEFGELVTPENEWGRHHKGLFQLGQTTESVGSGKVGSTFLGNDQTTYVKLSEVHPNMKSETSTLFIDCSEVIDESIFGFSFEKSPLLSSLVGWLDPVGAHTDYREEEIFKLIADVVYGRYEGLGGF